VARTVLVVDDSVTMRQMVAFTLGKAGFSVVEAGNGEEGLRRLENKEVDLIITDLNMPVMDGIEFIRRVRGRGGSRYTPVLMLTTESHESKKMQGKAAGATGWIVKPFNPERLVQVIGKVLP
jgi:two-component system chemotaxis response regulator CheY